MARFLELKMHVAASFEIYQIYALWHGSKSAERTASRPGAPKGLERRRGVPRDREGLLLRLPAGGDGRGRPPRCKHAANSASVGQLFAFFCEMFIRGGSNTVM